MHRFLCWLSSRWRSKCRASDCMFLWPAIAKRAASFEQFIDAATTHMVIDPAWYGHEHEWAGPNSPVTPWEWWRKNGQPAHHNECACEDCLQRDDDGTASGGGAQ